MNRLATITKRLAGALLLAVLLLPLGACNDFLDINDDPNNASPEDIESEPGLVFLTAATQFATNRTVEINEHSSFAQLWSASNGAAVFTNPELYSISTFTTGNTWSDMYLEVGQNTQLIIDAAEAADPPRPNAAGQARILQAFAYFHATQLWEDVPFSQANQPDEFPNPAFDQQEDVLRGVIAQIDEAIAQFDPSAPPGITTNDIFYGGNLDQWTMFGNTIKLRAYMMLRSGGADVDSEIGSLLGQPLIRTNANNAEFPYSSNSGNENSFWQVLADFSNGANIWYDCAAPLVDMMTSLNDPRLSTYCDPTQDGDFVGTDVGTFASFLSPDVSNVSLNVIRADFPERFGTAAETLLLEAEWYALQGDFGMADQKFEAGVRASMDWFDSKPGAIQDVDKDAYIASLPTIDGPEDIEDIQVQQWLDLFERRPEAWTHWRRTKVPDLSAPSNAQLNSIIRRYSYPPDPVARNPNTPTSKAGDVPMWFEGN